MDINGVDVAIRTDLGWIAADLIELAFRIYWPEAVIERVADSTAVAEFFVYENATAKQLWDDWASGTLPASAKMVQVTVDADAVVLTMDDEDDEMRQLLSDIRRMLVGNTHLDGRVSSISAGS